MKIWNYFRIKFKIGEMLSITFNHFVTNIFINAINSFQMLLCKTPLEKFKKKIRKRSFLNYCIRRFPEFTIGEERISEFTIPRIFYKYILR